MNAWISIYIYIIFILYIYMYSFIFFSYLLVYCTWTYVWYSGQGNDSATYSNRIKERERDREREREGSNMQRPLVGDDLHPFGDAADSLQKNVIWKNCMDTLSLSLLLSLSLSSHRRRSYKDSCVSILFGIGLSSAGRGDWLGRWRSSNGRLSGLGRIPGHMA